MKDESKSKLIIISELLFNSLPIIIIALIFIIKGNSNLIFFDTNWAFIAVIIFGQTIVKLASGIAKNNLKKNWQVISFIISVLIIFGLIPSSIILVLLYDQSLIKNIYLIIGQFIMFVFSIISYYLIGTVGQLLLDES